MLLQYAGPKPHISHTGIVFDNNKEDKFVYLGFVLHLIKALSHEYIEDKTYIYNINEVKIDDKMLTSQLEKICPNLQSLMKKEDITVEDEIQENIQRADENDVLSQEAIEVLQNNLKIMHDYLIQRAVNKRVYYCAIDALATLLKEDNIDHIIVPMYPKLVHVLRSVQGVLLKEKFPIDTKIDIYKEDSQLLAKLQVINL